MIPAYSRITSEIDLFQYEWMIRIPFAGCIPLSFDGKSTTEADKKSNELDTLPYLLYGHWNLRAFLCTEKGISSFIPVIIPLLKLINIHNRTNRWVDMIRREGRMQWTLLCLHNRISPSKGASEWFRLWKWRHPHRDWRRKKRRQSPIHIHLIYRLIDSGLSDDLFSFLIFFSDISPNPTVVAVIENDGNSRTIKSVRMTDSCRPVYSHPSLCQLKQ